MDLNPINQLASWWVVPIVMVIAWTTYVVLKKVFVTPYVLVMEERDQQLEAAEAVLAEAERIVAQAQPEAERIVAEAREAADSVLRAARDETETYARAAIEKAMDESARSLEDGRAKIAAAKESELASLRQEATECVGLACEQLLGSSDDDTVEAAVDRLFARKIH
jgi:F0F1-type ATP synthase membrane subunit b/b'